MTRRQIPQNIVAMYLLAPLSIKTSRGLTLDPVFIELIRKYRKVKAWKAEALAEKNFAGVAEYRSHEVRLATEIADWYLANGHSL